VENLEIGPIVASRRREMRRRPRIDEVLARPDMRAELEELKRLFGLAAHHHQHRDAEAQMAALLEGRDVALRIVAGVRALPVNATLPPEAVYRYIANVAHQELLGEQARADDVNLLELRVRFPAGRPPTSRSKAREQLIAEVRARPDMPDYLIADRGRSLGVWTLDQADDPTSRRRRIARIRAAGAK
jgi:hypothetical protein